ncbi:MAG TPA: GNAT family N-acetyltransferase [Steroidobacteraceae bacterium]|jgi:GNAT superfamily N-acetyltransferase|nr:GNAT family N-acetyltransferase [Steroidobacteraceae bacterium]
MNRSVSVRAAEAHEVALILGFIRELADFEHLAHEVVATEAALRQALYGPRPYAEVVFGCVDGEAVGFALYFHSFSTFLGRPGLYLEDLFVRPAARGRGVGGQLLSWLAGLALERGCGRLEWAVLDWNEAAIGFYRKLGAELKEEWKTCRVAGRALEALAARVD